MARKIREVEPEKNRSYERRYENEVLLSAEASDVFAFVVDHTRLSAHMSKPTWMMGGGHMETSVDSGLGQKVGSHIQMRGKVLGIALSLDEVVTDYEPPRVKVWETVGQPKLLVIGHYRMKIEVNPKGIYSLLHILIEYNVPRNQAWLGKLFGRYYAKWCVTQMMRSASDYFKDSSKH